MSNSIVSLNQQNYPVVDNIPLTFRNDLSSDCVNQFLQSVPHYREYTCLTYDPGNNEFKFFKNAISMTSIEKLISSSRPYADSLIETCVMLSVSFIVACVFLEMPPLFTILMFNAFYGGIFGACFYLNSHLLQEHDTVISRTNDQITTFLDSQSEGEFPLGSFTNNTHEVVVLDTHGLQLFQSKIEEIVNRNNNEPAKVLFIGNQTPFLI